MGIIAWLKKEGREIRLEEVRPPVRESVILICEKCGVKQSDDGDNPSRLLQKAIKRRLSSESRKSEVRALLTSCMNLCPKEKVAFCLVRFGGKDPGSRFFEMDWNPDFDATADLLLKKLAEP